MKKLLIGISLLSLLGCAKDAKQASYQMIDAKKAKEMMDSQEVVILDVRTVEEFNEGHIEHAINIPLADIESITLDQEQTILVYCRSGSRSKQASAILAEKGYTKIYEFGGILDWPYGLVK